MLCSLPSPKSSSSWLDRLHTLKGFNNPNSSISNPNSPIPNPNPSSSNPNSSNLNPNSPNSSNPSPNPNSSPPTEQMRSFKLVSSILSDLFVMDSPNSAQSETLTLKIGAKRGLRKQANPRICISAKKIRSTRNYSLPNGDKRLKENNNLKVNNKKITKEKKKQKKEMKKKKKKKKKKKRVETGLNLNLDSDSDSNSKSFSGTEATVIDTSTPGWKSAKILFRKGSNWKVRDKKRFNAAKKKKKKRFGLISNKSNQEPSSSTSPQNNHNEDTIDEPIFPIQTPIMRPKYSKPSVPEAAKSIAMHLKVRTKKKSSPLCKSSPLKEKIKI